jgi:hypothetical protein
LKSTIYEGHFDHFIRKGLKFAGFERKKNRIKKLAPGDAIRLVVSPVQERVEGGAHVLADGLGAALAEECVGLVHEEEEALARRRGPVEDLGANIMILKIFSQKKITKLKAIFANFFALSKIAEKVWGKYYDKQ